MEEEKDDKGYKGEDCRQEDCIICSKTFENRIIKLNLKR